MSVSYGGDKITFEDGSTVGSGWAGFKNRIINGAMVIDQRNNGALAAGAAGTVYGVDRFPVGVFGSGTGRISAQQSNTVPTNSGFVKSLIATVTTTDASPSANYGYCVAHYIEGYNIVDLGWGTANAKSVTLSFWVRSSLVGTYMVSFINADITWGYATTYTINEANTWEYKTITIPGATSGTWEKTNLRGIGLAFGLGGGANRQATLNSWYAPVGTNTPTDAAGCVDWIATSGATFYVTGVQIERGSQTTSFDYRSYGTELQMCQRYFWSSFSSVGATPSGWGANFLTTSGYQGAALTTGMINQSFFLPVPMRTSATASVWDHEGRAGKTSSFNPNVANNGNESGYVNNTSPTGFAIGRASGNNASQVGAYVQLNAEL
jgi:hypothetical protein